MPYTHKNQIHLISLGVFPKPGRKMFFLALSLSGDSAAPETCAAFEKLTAAPLFYRRHWRALQFRVISHCAPPVTGKLLFSVRACWNRAIRIGVKFLRDVRNRQFLKEFRESRRYGSPISHNCDWDNRNFYVRVYS